MMSETLKIQKQILKDEKKFPLISHHFCLRTHLEAIDVIGMSCSDLNSISNFGIANIASVSCSYRKPILARRSFEATLPDAVMDSERSRGLSKLLGAVLSDGLMSPPVAQT